MKVYNQIGSKERLVEIFQNVNKIKLNEDLGFNNSNDVKSILIQGFKALKEDQLSIQSGGGNNTTVEMNDNESTVQIIGVDRNRNQYTFVFKVDFNEGDQEGVFDVENVKILKFKYSSADKRKEFELNQDDLANFNTEHSNELFDIIDKYVDVKSPIPQNTGEIEEAIKLIDAIKKDSYPYGGGSDRFQTGKAYADEKPTNPKIRVKSPELDKFVQEGNIQEFDKPAMKLKMQPMAKMNKPIMGMTSSTVSESEAETKKYPDPMGKKFKPKSHYPKKKKKIQNVVKLSESTDRDKYEDVVFLQGDEAYEPLERLDREGPEAALEYLKQWHYPGEHQGSQKLGHGTGDKTYEKDGYIMSWNPRLDYIGLQYDMSKLNEPDMDEEAEPNQQKGIVEPIEKNDYDTNELGDANEPEVEDVPKDDGMSMEPESDEIENLSTDKEEVGELIPGGKGEGKTALEFSPDQILMGLRVEMEHTDDPMYALEIAIDHLSENPDYYTVKDTPDSSAQFNAASDAEKNIDDKDMTDMLLGYQPKNVGDEIEDDDMDDENKTDNIESTEVDNEIEPKIDEPAMDEPEEKKEMNESQIRMAKMTLNNRNIPTGMSKKDAVQIMIKHLIK